MMATRPGVLRQRKPERPDLTGEGTAGGERGSGVRSATLKGHALAETYSTVTAGKVVCKPQRHSRVSPLNLKRASAITNLHQLQFSGNRLHSQSLEG
jgi:hypothetical protein